MYGDRVPATSLEAIREVVHRLFIDAEGTALRREDEQKCRELAGLLPHLARLARGAHLVDAAAGKSSVGLVAAELLPLGKLTVLERDPGRVAASRAAAGRLSRHVHVDVRGADVADADAWPDAPDAVVALHACGGAADLVIDGAARSGARRLLLAPCCYGRTVPFAPAAERAARAMPFVADDVLRRRIAAALIDQERALRLEVAGFETATEELVGPTVTPHNLLFVARRTDDPVRIARARARLEALRAAGDVSA